MHKSDLGAMNLLKQLYLPKRGHLKLHSYGTPINASSLEHASLDSPLRLSVAQWYFQEL